MVGIDILMYLFSNLILSVICREDHRNSAIILIHLVSFQIISHNKASHLFSKSSYSLIDSMKKDFDFKDRKSIRFFLVINWIGLSTTIVDGYIYKHSKFS